MAGSAVQAAAVNTMRYSEGTYSAGGDEIVWSYYDTNPVPAAVGQVRYFVNPIGAGGKTIADTNMIAAGNIPKAQRFTAGAIKLFYTSRAAHGTAQVQDLYTFMQNTVAEVIIANKYTYGQWGLNELMGFATGFALTPTTAGDNIPLNLPKYHGIFPLKIPVILSENTNFEVRLTYTVTPGVYIVNDWLKISLQGVLKYAT